MTKTIMQLLQFNIGQKQGLYAKDFAIKAWKEESYKRKEWRNWRIVSIGLYSVIRVLVKLLK